MIVEIKIPSVGESISEVEIGDWLKREGESVAKDEKLVIIESDKATMELPAPVAGKIARIDKRAGAKVTIGEIIGAIEPGDVEVRTERAPAAATAQDKAPTPPAGNGAQEISRQASEPVQPERAPAAANAQEKAPAPPAGNGAQEISRQAESVNAEALKPAAIDAVPQRHVEAKPKPSPPVAADDARPSMRRRAERSVPLTPLRRAVAKRLVEAQHNAALLTTFNEIDMAALKRLREEQRQRFEERHQARLGFMSFFVKAAVAALRLVPQLNAELRGDALIYRDYYDVGVAVGSGKGLVVPVLRDADILSFAAIEKAIADFARRAGENQLRPEELADGTFTISNGGIYGSLLSTPIVNPPQSGILGMHAIVERPIAEAGVVVIRPMMYVALTYDHRVVDGREAVTFLKSIKESIESPARLLLEI